MKSDFVSTVSHELRTPLAAIYGAALTLRRDDITLEETQRAGLLDVIAGEADDARHAGATRGRAHFQEQLQALEANALGGLDLIIEQLDRVLEALRHQDVELAQMVIADDDRVDGRYLEVHQGILSLLALQAPVAGDLRLVAALLHTIKHIERMGDQCVNIAKLIPLSGYEPPVRPEVLDALAKMGAHARSEVVQCRAAFAGRDIELAEDLVRQDREINRLNRDIFRAAIEIGDDPDRLVRSLQERFPEAELVGGDRSFEHLVASVVGRGSEIDLVRRARQ